MKPADQRTMPAWYDRAAYLWRGFWLGLAVGYVVAGAWSMGDRTASIVVVVIVACFAAALASLPPAVVAQIDRLRPRCAGGEVTDSGGQPAQGGGRADPGR